MHTAGPSTGGHDPRGGELGLSRHSWDVNRFAGAEWGDPMRRVERLAETQGGVVSRIQAYDAGLTRGQLRAQVRARRWRRVGSQSLALTTGLIPLDGLRWAAVFEAGPRAHLDGVSSLLASGLEHFTADRIRVSVPRGARVRRGKGLDIRQTRRWSRDDVVGSGVPRTRIPVAAVRAALWARSDKQAALLLTMVVQQRLATVENLGTEALRIRRDRRRRLIHAVILDLEEGARSARGARVRPGVSPAWSPDTQSAGGEEGTQWSLLPRRDLGRVGCGGRDRRHPAHLGCPRRR